MSSACHGSINSTFIHPVALSAEHDLDRLDTRRTPRIERPVQDLPAHLRDEEVKGLVSVGGSDPYVIELSAADLGAILLRI